MIDQTIGHYKILQKLGEGGMGVVYLAEDLSLDRKVALKLVPAELASRRDRLERFQREARALAALDHPNIVTLYSVESAELPPGTPCEEEVDRTVHFLTMQYIEGVAVSDAIPSGGLEIDRILEIAIPLVDALAVAHDKGVIHRDLKPSNIMMTRTGQTKLMDFGVAKLIAEAEVQDSTQEETAEWGLTTSGAVMGTVSYMSPEQVRGEPLDGRSDLFSLGLVLYEMATGKKAFAGATHGVVFDNILNRKPQAPVELRPDIGTELNQIILKALEKDREVRYQTARDLQADLKRLRRDTTSGLQTMTAPAGVATGTAEEALPAAVGSERAEGRRRWLLTGALLAAVVILGVWAWQATSGPSIPEVEQIVQITSDRIPKNRLLTDGSRLYYVRGETGLDTTLNQVAVSGGEIVTIPVPFYAPYLVDLSPDRTEFLLIADRENIGTYSGALSLWAVPVLGGAPRPIGALRGTDAAWSPDGRWVAFTDEADLSIAGADGSDPHRIWTADGEATFPVWAPDSQRLRLTVVRAGSGVPEIWEIAADGSDPHPVLPDLGLAACCGRWSGDGRFYYFEAGNSDPTNVEAAPPDTHIWVLAERTGWLKGAASRPVRLTQGPVSYGRPVPSPEGTRVYVRGWKEAGEVVTCRVPEGECLPFLGGIDGEGVSFSRDGEWVAWIASNRALWRARVDGSERVQLTFPPPDAALPQWSPDGTQIVYASLSGPDTGILVIGADGGVPTPLLSEPPKLFVDSSWSPDGSRMALGEELTLDPRDRDREIYILNLETGGLLPVPESKGLFSPRWSPDGRYLAAMTTDSLRLLLYDFTTEDWRTLVDDGSISSYPVWTEDSQSLYASTVDTRYRVSIVDGRKEIVHSFTGLRRLSRQFGVWHGQAPDGSVLTVRNVSLDELFALELVPSQ